MKVKELLEYQSFVTKRATPSDMNKDEVSDHYSTSKDEHINILDMDLVHLIRSYSKCLDSKGVSNTDLMRKKLDTILKETSSIREMVDKSE